MIPDEVSTWDDEMTISYRLAEDRDHRVMVDLMVELIDELGPHDSARDIKSRLDEDIRLALSSPQVVIFLALNGDEVIGLSRGDVLTQDPIFRLRSDHRCGYIDQMYVKTEYRRQQIGAQLLTLCENWFRDQGIGHCILHAALRAIRFYARAGYQSNREMFKKLS